MPFLKAGFNARHRETGIRAWTRPAAGGEYAAAELLLFAGGDYAWHGERFLAWGEACVIGTVVDLAEALYKTGFVDFGLPQSALPPCPLRRPRPVQLRLPYPVSANRYWRSFGYNPRGGGKAKAVTFLSDEAKAFKEECGWIAKAAGVRVPFTGPVELRVRLVPENRVCMDLDNALKVTVDALKGVVYADDEQIMKIVAERGDADPTGKHLEVEVLPYLMPTELELAA